MFTGLKWLWKYIEKLLRFIGKVQSTLLLSLAYYLVVGPVAIVYRLAKAFKGKSAQVSYWLPRSREGDTKETLRRQF